MSKHIGLVGLSTMGANLARNLASKNWTVSLYNRTAKVTEDLVKEYPLPNFKACYEVEEFVKSLPRPRGIILLVKAGAAVDGVIETILPYLEKDDILMDWGNSLYRDTERREAMLAEKGIRYLGVGISGGEEGALNGASIMPGGDKASWEKIKDVFSDPTAIVNSDPCSTYVGPGGSGHFVKMVHNGIEYADMQLLGECYLVLKELCGLKSNEASDVFASWNESDLGSFLIEISTTVLKAKDPHNSDGLLIDKVLDEAGQKGTGRWTSIAAFEYGVSAGLIHAAVESRGLSSAVEARKSAKTFGSYKPCDIDKKELISTLTDAYRVARLLAYCQGLQLISAASQAHNWNINLSDTAKIWRGGCIIRSKHLELLRKALSGTPKIDESFIFNKEFSSITETGVVALNSLAKVLSQAEIPAPCFMTAVSVFNTLKAPWLATRLIQGQRDYFGAHTFKRTDKEGVFHEKWA